VRRFPRALAAALGLLLAAAPQAAAALPPGSSGQAAAGQLEGAFDLPLAGAGYRFYGPVAQRQAHFATLELAALIARAARVLAAEVPGPPVVLGDFSREHGGPLRRHASHQSGRDVDVIFLARGADGAAVEAGRFAHYDGDGRCVDADCTWTFDTERNWWFVRTLLASRTPAVQWIFVSAPLARRLIAWAEAQGEHPTLLARARKVLRQPTGSAPHDDHFHVRIYCSHGVLPADANSACADTGPRWPWVDAHGDAAPL